MPKYNLKGWKRLWVCLLCHKTLLSPLPENNSKTTRKMRKDNLCIWQNQDAARTLHYEVSGRVAKSSGDYSGMHEERGNLKGWKRLWLSVAQTSQKTKHAFQSGGLPWGAKPHALYVTAERETYGGRRSNLESGLILRRKNEAKREITEEVILCNKTSISAGGREE